MGQFRTTLTILILVLTIGQSVGQNTKIKLSDKFNGHWINTSLFDSTTIKRKLSPWINEFYGTAILEFTKDTVLLLGCSAPAAFLWIRWITETVIHLPTKVTTIIAIFMMKQI
jgi:hypothetical protein